MKPVPDNVIRDADWDFDTPLYQLTARCIKGWPRTVVGSKFRWNNESISLPTVPPSDTTFDDWQALDRHIESRPRINQGLPRMVCSECKTVSRMVPKGAKRV